MPRITPQRLCQIRTSARRVCPAPRAPSRMKTMLDDRAEEPHLRAAIPRLRAARFAQGYASSLWASESQWFALGAFVKPEEVMNGTLVCLARPFGPESFVVFNAEQVQFFDGCRGDADSVDRFRFGRSGPVGRRGSNGYAPATVVVSSVTIVRCRL